MAVGFDLASILNSLEEGETHKLLGSIRLDSGASYQGLFRISRVHCNEVETGCRKYTVRSTDKEGYTTKEFGSPIYAPEKNKWIYNGSGVEINTNPWCTRQAVIGGYSEN